MGQMMSVTGGTGNIREAVDNIVNTDNNGDEDDGANLPNVQDTSDSDDEQLSSNLEDRTFQNILAVLAGRQSLELR